MNERHNHARVGFKTATYRTWEKMKDRCFNPKNNRFHRYGGRGITVCKRWFKFPQFLLDMGEKPKGLSIERINNDGNYEPSNCKWATRVEQSYNRIQNRFVLLGGLRLPITKAEEFLGVRQSRIWNWMNRNSWPNVDLQILPPGNQKWPKAHILEAAWKIAKESNDANP